MRIVDNGNNETLIAYGDYVVKITVPKNVVDACVLSGDSLSPVSWVLLDEKTKTYDGVYSSVFCAIQTAGALNQKWKGARFVVHSYDSAKPNLIEFTPHYSSDDALVAAYGDPNFPAMDACDEAFYYSLEIED